MYFDSHAHLDDEKFDEDRHEVIEGLKKRGICGVIDPGDSIDSSKKAVELAEEYDFIYAAVGIHPHEAGEVKDEDMDILASMASHPKVVAIGEIGLDYYYDFSPKDRQKEELINQIELAYRLDLPIIIHDRDAHGDMVDIIKDHRDMIKGGVMHCFSGSWELAKVFMDYGFYIALGGSVTFKNARRPVEVAQNIPLDRLLIETDSPYMTPVPYRGQRNDPGYVSLVAQRIGELRNMNGEDIGYITAQNISKAFPKVSTPIQS